MRIVVAAALLAIVLPVVLLGRAMSVAPGEEGAEAPVEWIAVPSMGAAMARPLLTPVDGGEVVGAPELVGIAGRLNVDAVAMVRGADGGVRALKPGEGVDGWQLRSLSIDAAYFTRGSQEARVPLDTESVPQ